MDAAPWLAPVTLPSVQHVGAPIEHYRHQVVDGRGALACAGHQERWTQRFEPEPQTRVLTRTPRQRPPTHDRTYMRPARSGRRGGDDLVRVPSDPSVGTPWTGIEVDQCDREPGTPGSPHHRRRDVASHRDHADPFGARIRENTLDRVARLGGRWAP